jgi:GH24 family phage-related lysozyme (muramidase)
MEMRRIQKNERNLMKITKKFLMEQAALASAVTALSMATNSADSATKPPKYADDEIRKMIMQDEGFVDKQYADPYGIATTGYGHNLKNTKQSEMAFSRAFGDEGPKIRQSVMSGGKLTKQQAEALFNVDYEERRNMTAKMIPKLHEYPSEVQGALVSGTYRGHVSGSPKFRALLNAGKFEEAADELLRNDEYLNPKKDKSGKVLAPGVLTRMERDANLVRGMANKSGTTGQQSGSTVTTGGQQKKPVTTQQKPVTTGSYEVQTGDNLYRIAQKHGKKLDDIIKANPQIKDPSKIQPKDKIIIP